MKGIILAAGKGSRLYPLTYAISKPLLPVYDKPMVYYALDVLLKAGIRDILIISTKEDAPRFMYLFGSGKDFGIHIEFDIQYEAKGISDSFLIADAFIGKEDVALILSDNIFIGKGLEESVAKLKTINCIRGGGAVLFATEVKDPERFGVVEFDRIGKPCSIVEKPKNPKSNWAVTGLYFYNNNVVNFAKSLKPSARGELEITDINKIYLERGKVEIIKFPSTLSYLDAGTFESLREASNLVKRIEEQDGCKYGCIEETCFRNSWMTKGQVLKRAEGIKNSYGEYLKKIVED